MQAFQQLQWTEVELRPSRLNAAGWCMWCLELGCLKARCIELHECSAWAVCPDCDGCEFSDIATSTRCHCMGGVIEMTSAPLSVVR
ncbi:hypothetical protein AWN90_03685 [Nocardia terpenica]|uniref:Uncharacterized protein n=1 Tax=Nocardia terpenica TaxID=455432 RepID=A0A164JGW9_9NOCA|nr:hypothetical protein AWN90_03685 [Nocardia terpenica]